MPPTRKAKRKAARDLSLIEKKLPVEVLVRCLFPLVNWEEKTATKIAQQRRDVLRCGWVCRHFREAALLVGLRLDDKARQYDGVTDAVDIVSRYRPWPVLSVSLWLCPALVRVGAFSRCHSVTLVMCDGVVDVTPLSGCASVTLLLCQRVVSVDALRNCKTLCLSGCRSITTADAVLADVPNLVVDGLCGTLHACKRPEVTRRWFDVE